MSPTYLLWHTQRQGWVCPIGTTTDREQASRFSHEEALRIARRNVADKVLGVLPILEDDVLEVSK